MDFSPMLARNYDPDKLVFPVFATPKIDGIRCINVNGKVMSRKLQPIPNDHVRTVLESILPPWADGEVRPVTTDQAFGTVVSQIMRRKGEPKFRFYMFDIVCDGTYLERVDRMIHWYNRSPVEVRNIVQLLIPDRIDDLDQLSVIEEQAVTWCEGLILRSGDSPYKCGRSTVKEGWMLKVKHFYDSEAVITGFKELLTNENEATLDALGHVKRSRCAEGLIPAGTLGTIVVRDFYTDIEFEIGSGFTPLMRDYIWNNKRDMLGCIVKYKHQPHGADVKPRCPVFTGFRSSLDMGEPA